MAEMEYTIEDIEEVNGSLVVTVDHAFGTSKFGFSLESRKLDPKTDEPRFLSLVEKHLELKFGDNNRRPKKMFNEYIGQKFRHKKINITKVK
jgi:hypothetical protein